ncbi:hypothetical protein GCM10025768_17140 [Microbacterium pseudoresistens]|uniref:Uncharacterized protein n=1 Tax=Microbacterium pseudoresistens TaxID=640634 RepID=A0A7Y9JNW0_9MICO|nr:hypothetical protein [Microbacterium pseudoresistens]NYD55750.1 hypothetical protein [Microbacterium pseudoresistens]
MTVRIALQQVPATGGWLDDAASGLEQSTVYVGADVVDADGLRQALEQVVPQDGSMGVAVLPKDAVLESAYSTYLLDQLFQGSDYDTLVVAVGSDLQADSHVIAGDEAMRIANEAETAAGGDLQGALTETVRQLTAETPVQGVPDAPSELAGAGAGGAWLLTGAIAVVVAAAGAGVAVAAVRRRARRREETAVIPVAIAERLARLVALSHDYAALGAEGDAVAARTAHDIETLTANVGQLFPRLDARAGAAQRSLAEVEYTDKLGRLVAALDHDYLYDLLENPQLWEAPEERIREVQEALSSVSAQVLENVKQVNARKGLHFQVSLDSLVERDELRDWDEEFRRSAEG